MDNWAVSASSASVDVFRVSGRGQLRTARFNDPGGWTAWSVIGPSVFFPAGQPVCAVANAGAVHAFVVDHDGNVHHFVRVSATAAWHASTVSGLKASSASLAAVAPPGGPVMLLAQTTFAGVVGAMVATTLGGGGWSAPAAVGTPASPSLDDGSLSAIVQPGSQVHLFSRTNDGDVRHAALVPGAPFEAAAWNTLSNVFAYGRPRGVARTATSLDVVTLDTLAITVSDKAIDGGAWQTQQFSDQEPDSQPAIGVAIGANSVAVMGYGTLTAGFGVTVSRVTIDAAGKATWGPWQLVPVEPEGNDSQLCAILRANRHLDLFINRGDSMLTATCDITAPHWTWSALHPIAPKPHWQAAPQ